MHTRRRSINQSTLTEVTALKPDSAQFSHPNKLKFQKTRNNRHGSLSTKASTLGADRIETVLRIRAESSMALSPKSIPEPVHHEPAVEFKVAPKSLINGDKNFERFYGQAYVRGICFSLHKKDKVMDSERLVELQKTIKHWRRPDDVDWLGKVKLHRSIYGSARPIRLVV